MSSRSNRIRTMKKNLPKGGRGGSGALGRLRSEVHPKKDRVTLFQRGLNVSPSLVSTALFRGVYADAGTTNTTFAEFKPNTLLNTSQPTTSSLAWYPPALTDRLRDYSNYRVLGYRYTLDILSRSTSDYFVFVIDSSDSTGVTTGSIAGQSSALAVRYSRMFTIPGTGKSPCHLKLTWQSHSMMKLLGSDEYLTDDSYNGGSSSSGVATDPTNLTYLTLVSSLCVPGTQTANNAPQFTLTMEQDVEFYNPRV